MKNLYMIPAKMMLVNPRDPDLTLQGLDLDSAQILLQIFSYKTTKSTQMIYPITQKTKTQKTKVTKLKRITDLCT